VEQIVSKSASTNKITGASCEMISMVFSRVTESVLPAATPTQDPCSKQEYPGHKPENPAKNVPS